MSTEQILDVASFTDAWIETNNGQAVFEGVLGSHLLQMRGLKHNFLNFKPSQKPSHLLQMRGLKRIVSRPAIFRFSRIFYRCVD